MTAWLCLPLPPVLFSAVVGESGQKKSPVYRTLIKKPLRELQNEAKQIYDQQLAQWEYEMSEWEKGSPEACRSNHRAKPEKPSLPVYFFTDATGEGIKTQAQETPSKAMFALIDELAGLFNSANQYRGGKGSDRQDILSYYDGLGQTVLRAGGIKVDVERIYLSIFGGIQPDVLKGHTKDLKDADGHWARFLFVSQPLAASTLPDDNSDINLKDLLSHYYGRIASLPLIQYKLSPEAFKRYQEVYNELELKRVGHPQAGMRAVYSKMEGAIGRLALNLHALDIAASDSTRAFVKNEISLETMNKAIALAQFYIKEIKNLHAESKADKGELPAILAKILNKALSKGVITARDGARLFDKMTSNQVLTHFRELEAMGHGLVEKNKNSWSFTPTVSAVSEVSVASVSENKKYSKPESIENRSFAPNLKPSVSSVSAVSEFGQKPPTPIQEEIEDIEENEAPQNLDKPVEPIEPTVSENENGKENPTSCDNTEEVKSTDSPDSTDTEPESIENRSFENCQWTTGTKAKVTDSSDETSLKPLNFSFQAGDRVKCYPSQRHEDSDWKVNATVIEVQSERGWFISCTIQYTNKKKEIKTVHIAGGCVDWILQKL